VKGGTMRCGTVSPVSETLTIWLGLALNGVKAKGSVLATFDGVGCCNPAVSNNSSGSLFGWRACIQHTLSSWAFKFDPHVRDALQIATLVTRLVSRK
jgi:hypothetical protein